MRERVRIQPYVPRAEQRRLQAYAAAQNLTESAVVEAALADYFGRDADQQPVVLRRLDAMSIALGHLRRDVDILTEAFSVFVRLVFSAIPDPPDRGQARANQLYELFVKRVARHLGAGMRLTGDVRKAQADVAVKPPAAGQSDGR